MKTDMNENHEIPVEAYRAILDNNWHGAFSIIHPLALNGNANAEHYMGWFYEQGIEVEQSYLKAFEWWQRSAAKNIAESQCALAQLYENGYGVNQSDTEAFIWYSRAIMNNDEEAELLITPLYTRMSEQDVKEARKVLQQSQN